MFKPVSPKLDVTSMEEGVLKFWKQNDIFKKTVEQREGGPEYVFYEGPPTANGKPGVHHVLARAFQDMFPRGLGIVQRFASVDGQLRPIPAPMLVRAFVSLFFSYQLAETIFGDSAPQEFSENAMQHYVDIFLHGILET